MDFSIFLNGNAWIGLITLTFLEIILGIDNIVFISIVTNKLPVKQRKKARNIGLLLAMLFRIVLLFSITWVLKMNKIIFSFEILGSSGAFTGQSIILFLGGIFLLYKSVSEIHEKLEGNEKNSINTANAMLTKVIIQIILLDIVFSFDSILTAIGLTKELLIMILAIIISIAIMMLFAGPVSRFVNEHPTIQILGLSFLILIGFMLIVESAHLSHIKFQDFEIGNIPKGYLYFAIFFSLLVEFLNMKFRKSNPLDLKYSEKIGKDFDIEK